VDLNAGRFAVEVRNKDWLDARLTDLFREHNVALALTDTSFMPRPWEMKGTLDLITADFTYVRWLGNRKGIEEQTTTWDKTVIDRQDDLKSWVVVIRRLVEDKRIRRIFAFANNHLCRSRPSDSETVLGTVEPRTFCVIGGWRQTLSEGRFCKGGVDGDRRRLQ
jgi:uncharacterized protein YecE (DUF72 family)